MKKQNTQLVEPILEKLRKDTIDLHEQMNQTEEAYKRESLQKKMVEVKLLEVEALKAEKTEELRHKHDAYHCSQLEPSKLQRTMVNIENAYSNMEKDYHSILKRTEHVESEHYELSKKRDTSRKTHLSIVEKLELNRQTLEEREHDIVGIRAKLDASKNITHELITRKMEITIKKRDLESHLRHLKDSQSLIHKEYDTLKRLLKKKRVVLSIVSQNLPGLENQLKEAESHLRFVLDGNQNKNKEINKLKEEFDYHLAKLLQQEGVEENKKKVRDCG
jgi:hypothetical protein